MILGAHKVSRIHIPYDWVELFKIRFLANRLETTRSRTVNPISTSRNLRNVDLDKDCILIDIFIQMFLLIKLCFFLFNIFGI